MSARRSARAAPTRPERPSVATPRPAASRSAHGFRAFAAVLASLRRGLGFRAFAAVLASLVLLADCGPDAPRFKGSDVTGTSFARDFDLVDHEGRRRTLADFRGKVTVVFFGFTHCPDVCPTTLAELAEAMKRLGSDAERVQVLFVTVDPERDTPELLKRYVPAFHPTFLGLTGTPEQMRAVTKEFRILAEKRPGATPDAYTVDHSAGTFLFDPEGRLRVYVSYGQGPDVFTHDIRALLRG
jgi:protein SCO1/2